MRSSAVRNLIDMWAHSTRGPSNNDIQKGFPRQVACAEMWASKRMYHAPRDPEFQVEFALGG